MDASEFLSGLGERRAEYSRKHAEMTRQLELLRKEQSDFEAKFQQSAVKLLNVEQCSVIEGLLDRRRVVITPNDERDIVTVFKKVFRNRAGSRTHTLVKEKTKEYYTTRGSIVFGSYGFGLRDNVNASQVYSWDEVRYVWSRKAEVCAALRKEGLVAVANDVEKFFAAIPSIDVFDRHVPAGLTVRLSEPVQGVNRSRMPGVVKRVMFRNSYSGLQVAAVVESKGELGPEEDEIQVASRGSSGSSNAVIGSAIGELLAVKNVDFIGELTKRVEELEEYMKQGSPKDRLRTVFAKEMLLYDA
jgi:hypothetical protein